MKPFFVMALFSTLLIAGCMTVSTYYNDLYSEMPDERKARLILDEKESKLYRYSGNMQEDELSLFENGYAIIGYSSFNSSSISEQEILDHAKSVKADIAMVASEYTDTVTGNIPITTYKSQHSSSIITGDVNARITTTGPSIPNTTYIPYSVNRFDYYVTFWVKTKPMVLGVLFDDLPLQLRQKIERNKGVVVIAVQKNSPAYNYGVIPGDVIIEVSGEEVQAKETFNIILSKNTGQVTLFKIIRNGVTKEIEIKLNNLN